MKIAGHRPKVLVMENEPLIALDLIDALEKACFEVVGPWTTIERAERELSAPVSFDAAVIDLKLADGHAGAIAQRLLNEAIPVVIASAWGNAEVVAALPQAVFFAKPYRSAEVVAAVVQATARVPDVRQSANVMSAS
ncbi:MAG: response regulator [Hyphomicrobiales bacterium]